MFVHPTAGMHPDKQTIFDVESMSVNCKPWKCHMTENQAASLGVSLFITCLFIT